MFNRSLFFVCYASDIMASKDSLSPLHTHLSRRKIQRARTDWTLTTQLSSNSIRLRERWRERGERVFKSICMYNTTMTTTMLMPMWTKATACLCDHFWFGQQQRQTSQKHFISSHHRYTLMHTWAGGVVVVLLGYKKVNTTFKFSFLFASFFNPCWPPFLLTHPLFTLSPLSINVSVDLLASFWMPFCK